MFARMKTYFPSGHVPLTNQINSPNTNIRRVPVTPTSVLLPHTNDYVNMPILVTRLEGARSLEYISSDVLRDQGKSFQSGCSPCELKPRPIKK